jgi:SWIM/SEC-C metal-binding protein
MAQGWKTSIHARSVERASCTIGVPLCEVGYAREDRVARIGTKKRPAVVRVQTEERAHEVLGYCTERAIQVLVGVEPDKDEDLTDIARALGAPVPPPAERRAPEKVSRNDPCPCGSGRKYKKCCLDRAASAG